MPMRWIVAVVSIALVALGEAPAIGQTPKPGGMLTLRLREDLPQGFSINESPTISTMWPAMPCFSNLVLFDPAKPTHSADTIIGELAERWAWEENYRKLVLALRARPEAPGMRLRIECTPSSCPYRRSPGANTASSSDNPT